MATSKPTSPPRANKRVSMIKIVKPPTKEQTAAKEARIKNIVWRDFSFLVLAAIGAHMMTYVELNASNAELRGGESSESGVVDTGYIATTTFYNFLKENRKWNDIFAALNSVALFVPGVYTAYVTLWKGDYDLAFRYMATHLLRSFCGWFTYLPPDPTYLPSNYDFPDIWQCVLVKDCSQAEDPEVLPFVSFFSGHVSTMVCTANHMYVNGYRRLGIFCHVMNVLQILRMLATRGHYSIDMIIAWYISVYVSNPAGRLGRYYSRGKTLTDVMPETATEAFETITGVSGIKEERRLSRLVKKQDLQKVLKEMEQDDEIDELVYMVESSSETTATLLADELAASEEQAKKTN